MLYNIILSVIISIILIIVVHYLFLFFKDTLTVPIVKDMVIKPSQTYKYLETISTDSINVSNLSNSTELNNLSNSTELNNLSDSTDLNNLSDSNNMKLELKHYLNDLNYTSNNLELNSKLYSEIR